MTACPTLPVCSVRTEQPVCVCVCVCVCVHAEAVREKAQPVVEACSGQLKAVVCFEAPADDPSSFHAQLEVGAAHPAPALDTLNPDSIATLIYTSGTTGKPKGVMLTHRNIASNVQAMRTLIGDRMNEETTSLSFLPWAHIYGQTAELHSLLSAGGALALAESPKTLLDDIKAVKPTVLIAVPTVYNKIFDAIRQKIASASKAKATVFNQAMEVAKERRRYFDEGRETPDPWLWAKWTAASKLAFGSIHKLLGGRIHYAITGGAALSHAVQEFFDDIGIPIMYVET